MLDEFRRIAETAVPHPIQSRLVTPDEARAVISSFNRLTDPMRTNFLDLPVENIIEFSMMQTKKRPSLYNYMHGVKESVAEPLPDAPQAIPATERDHLDAPAPIQETATVAAPEKPTRKKRPIAEAHPEVPPEAPAAETFFTRLIERLEHLATPQPNVLDIQHALMTGLTALTERVEQLSADTDRSSLIEMVAIQKDMAVTLSESQTQIIAVQNKLIETQGLIVESLNTVAGKLAEFTQTPPVINLPAPIINLTTQEGRRIKTIERDQNNLLSKVIESYEEVS